MTPSERIEKVRGGDLVQSGDLSYRIVDYRIEEIGKILDEIYNRLNSIDALFEVTELPTQHCCPDCTAPWNLHYLNKEKKLVHPVKTI